MSLSFARGALHGIDRFVPQVRKITFFYCKHGGSSKGMRYFTLYRGVEQSSSSSRHRACCESSSNRSISILSLFTRPASVFYNVNFVLRCREFIQRDLADFARGNPSIVMEARIRGNAHPYIRGEYSMRLWRTF
jgi:hypothetical protein